MALLNKLKSILGIGGGRDEGNHRTDTSVTVEREASGPASEESTTPHGDEDESTDAEDPVAAGTDATASTGSMTDSAGDDTETAAEPSEAAAPPSDATEEDDTTDHDIDDVINEAEPETDTDDAVAAGTDATASTDSLVDEQTDANEAAEASEAAGPPTGSIEDADEVESAGDTEESVDTEAKPVDDSEESANDHADEPNSESGQPVEEIKGIGPAYSDRLSGAGIDSVSELAAADAEELGEAIDVSPKIVGDWIDRADGQ